MITNELELFYQSEAMTYHPSTLTMTLRSVIASCIACSLLILPSFASAQGELGALDQGSGSKVESPIEPLTPGSSSKNSAGQQPGVVIRPGASPAFPVADEGAPPVEQATTESAEGAEVDLTLKEKEMAWMAELKQLTFKQLVERIRKDEQRIDQLYIGMPTLPQQQLVYDRQIRGLQAEVVVLNQLLEPASVEAFRANPLESKAATEKVFEVLASKLAPRGRQAKYDPEGGLRLVNTILEIKGGNVGMEPGVKPLPEDEPFVRIIFQGYLASYGMQDFNSADAFLTRLENMEIGLDPKLREDFQATLEAWKDEESLRAREARADDLPRVKLETTDGDVIIELFENEAPNTVANFIKLVKEGYYDGLEFFHVVPSNYARSGCKANDGTTNPGYRIRNEFENGRRHFKGTVVMQNDGENTAGSQFVILHRPDPNLIDKVVAFGRVIEGLDLVYGFKPVNRIRNPGGEATVVTKATVLRDRGHAYEPEIIEDAASMLRRQADELKPSGSSSRAPATGGSSSRSPSFGGSSSRTPSTGGSSSRAPSFGGSSSRTPSTGGSSSR